MNNNDVLAYLHVLGHPTAGSRVFRRHVLGCLNRVIDQAKAEGHLDLVDAIKERERINGYQPYGHPDLIAANIMCIQMILDIDSAKERSIAAILELQTKLEATPEPSAELKQLESYFNWLNEPTEYRQKLQDAGFNETDIEAILASNQEMEKFFGTINSH